MRVLIATGLYPPDIGGPATYSKLLEDMLPQRGIAVSVLPFGLVRRLPPGIRHAAYFFKALSLARGADVVYAQDTVSVGFPASLAALCARKKFLVRVPGDYAWEQASQRFGVIDGIDVFQTKSYGLRVGLLRAVQTFVARRALAVIVPSAYMQTIVSGWVKRPERVRVIYSSISLPIETVAPADRPTGCVLVTVARLVPWKGIDGLLRVVAQKPEWHLIVVGDGPERERLEALAGELKMGERVRFTGALPRAQALGWVKAADVFVLNSTYEGLSYLLIEAMSLGTPAVATKVGGNPEVVEHNVNGMLVAPGDSAALLRALEEIEAHRDKARELAQAGADHIAKTFSAQRAIESLVDILNTL